MKNETQASGALAGVRDDFDHPDGLLGIREMADEFGVTLRTLRFYEDQGLIQPERRGATRLYSHADKTRLRLILLGRRIGFSVRDVKQVMDLYEPGGSNLRQLGMVLDKSRQHLARLEEERAAIDEAIGEANRVVADTSREFETRKTR